jgi:hypothetical protein
LVCMERFLTQPDFMVHPCVTGGEHPTITIGYYTPPVDPTASEADTLAATIGETLDALDENNEVEEVEPTIRFTDDQTKTKKKGNKSMYLSIFVSYD